MPLVNIVKYCSTVWMYVYNTCVHTYIHTYVRTVCTVQAVYIQQTMHASCVQSVKSYYFLEYTKTSQDSINTFSLP